MIQTLFGPVEQEPSLLEKSKSGVQKTRAGLVSALENAIEEKKEIDADLLDELEHTLISADIGVKTTEEILAPIRERVQRHQLNDAGELKGLIREHLQWSDSGTLTLGYRRHEQFMGRELSVRWLRQPDGQDGHSWIGAGLVGDLQRGDQLADGGAVRRQRESAGGDV
jgi:hypothetical protein